jgi:hypothetical protein
MTSFVASLFGRCAVKFSCHMKSDFKTLFRTVNAVLIINDAALRHRQMFVCFHEQRGLSRCTLPRLHSFHAGGKYAIVFFSAMTLSTAMESPCLWESTCLCLLKSEIYHLLSAG